MSNTSYWHLFACWLRRRSTTLNFRKKAYLQVTGSFKNRLIYTWKRRKLLQLKRRQHTTTTMMTGINIAGLFLMMYVHVKSSSGVRLNTIKSQKNTEKTPVSYGRCLVSRAPPSYLSVFTVKFSSISVCPLMAFYLELKKSAGCKLRYTGHFFSYTTPLCFPPVWNCLKSHCNDMFPS